MLLNSSDLNFLCNTAINAAVNAGALISSYTHKNLKVKRKQGGSSLASQVVTEVDLKSQEIILQELEESIKIYDLALLTEESEDDNSRFEKDYFWCIDPLDGTLPFTQGKIGYAVSIALVSKTGIPHIGVVFDPVTKTLYHAIKDEGAFKQNKRWVSDPSNNTFSYVPAGSLRTHFRQRRIFKELKSKVEMGKFKRVNALKVGGAVMNAIWVLENSPACYIKFPKNKPGGGSLWDYAATACIATELGGLVTDFYGKKLELNPQGSTYMNTNGVIYSTFKDLYKFIGN